MLTKVTLTDTNLKRIKAHQPFQLAHQQLQGGPHTLDLKPAKAKRIQTALRKGKGVRLHLEPQEMQGMGLFADLRGEYNRRIKPMVRPALHRGVQALAPRVQRAVQRRAEPVLGRRTARQLSQGAVNVLHQGVDEIGDVTGAYGLGADIRRGYRRAKPMIRRGLQNLVKTGLKTAVQTFAPGAGAVLNPAIDRYSDRAVAAIGDATGGFSVNSKHHTKHGGSFRNAGYGLI